MAENDTSVQKELEQAEDKIRRLEAELESFRDMFADMRNRLAESEREVADVRRIAECASEFAEDAAAGTGGGASDGGMTATSSLPANLPPQATEEPYAYKVIEIEGTVYCYLPKKPEEDSEGDNAQGEGEGEGSNGDCKEFCGGAYGGPHLGSKEDPTAESNTPPYAKEGYEDGSDSDSDDFSWAHFGWHEVGQMQMDGGSVNDKVVVATFKVPLDPAEEDRDDNTEIEGPSLSSIELMDIPDWKESCKDSWKEFDERCGDSVERKIPIALLANGIVTQLCVGVPFLHSPMKKPLSECEDSSDSSDSGSDSPYTPTCTPDVEIDEVGPQTGHPNGGYKITATHADCTQEEFYVWNGNDGEGGGSGSDSDCCATDTEAESPCQKSVQRNTSGNLQLYNFDNPDIAGALQLHIEVPNDPRILCKGGTPPLRMTLYGPGQNPSDPLENNRNHNKYLIACREAGTDCTKLQWLEIGNLVEWCSGGKADEDSDGSDSDGDYLRVVIASPYIDNNAIVFPTARIYAPYVMDNPVVINGSTCGGGT